VWQLPQLRDERRLPFCRIALELEGGTLGKVEVGVETVPTTVVGVGEATPSEPQPASATAPSSTRGDESWVAHRDGL
jgi:hypothetical protein